MVNDTVKDGSSRIPRHHREVLGVLMAFSDDALDLTSLCMLFSGHLPTLSRVLNNAEDVMARVLVNPHPHVS
ncbi:hypothetical protein PHMEG_00026386 [Phytophthora megakarya]|uniref:Uncharacterized protein n=1 Tax=Phytophthora megakarya TaxID=4795 RepID=A0A225VC98_9STRA|nr:hypothetical protein PHMEG_00026386 [Phytophthora megakarya]